MNKNDREAIARIIAPEEWRDMDRYLAIANSLAANGHFSMAVDAFNDAEFAIVDSLTKADAILSISRHDGPAGDVAHLIDRLSRLDCTMVEVCEPHPGNTSRNIIPMVRKELIDALAQPASDKS
jgi:hypothetical protein